MFNVVLIVRSKHDIHKQAGHVLQVIVYKYKTTIILVFNEIKQWTLNRFNHKCM